MLGERLIAQVETKHLAWLAQFGEQRVKQFRKLFAADLEAALCEAMVADFLNQDVDRVEPHEDLSTGGTDFVCVNQGVKFYVEATCLKIAAVEKASWVPDDPDWKGGSRGSISALVRTTVSNKVIQCSKTGLRMDAPVLIAVCHLHQWESMHIDKSFAEELLISDTGYTIEINPNNPLDRKPGYMFTELRNALFLAIDRNGLQMKRQPVSAVLMCGFGFGIDQRMIIGCRNPSAVRPFDPSVLPTIIFAETVVDRERVGLKYFNNQ